MWKNATLLQLQRGQTSGLQRMFKQLHIIAINSYRFVLLFLYWGLPPRNQSRKPRASSPAGRSLGISQLPVVSGGSFTLLGSWKAMRGDHGATEDPSCDHVTKEIENIRKSLKIHRVPEFFWNPQFCQVLDHYDQIIPNDMKRLSNHPFKISLPFFSERIVQLSRVEHETYKTRMQLRWPRSMERLDLHNYLH